MNFLIDQRYKTAFEKISSATGLTDPEEIFQKYLNKETEEATLLAQKTTYENKLTELTAQKETLLMELEQLKYVSRSSNVVFVLVSLTYPLFCTGMALLSFLRVICDRSMTPSSRLKDSLRQIVKNTPPDVQCSKACVTGSYISAVC